MLNFHRNNILAVFGGTVFQQTIRIPQLSNCAPLLADLFLFSYEYEFVQKLLSNKQKTLASSLNFIFRYICIYIDYIISINDRSFRDHLHTIYTLVTWKSKIPRKNAASASYLNLLLSVTDGTISTKLTTSIVVS